MSDLTVGRVGFGPEDIEHLTAEAEQHTRDYDDAAVLRALARIAELETENAELRKDKARLDLLETGEYDIDWRYRDACGVIVYRGESGSHEHGETLRDALDGWMERKA